MLLNNITKSSMMPPRRDNVIKPQLEKRRIVGSLRERTVYLQSPSNSQNYQNEKNLELRKSILFDQLLNDLALRINNHVERELTAQQVSIDQKIDEIDEHTQSNLLIQETLENRLRKLRKKLKQKNQSHSQPSPSCRSGVAFYKHPIHHFTNTSDASMIDENDSQNQETSSPSHEQTSNDCSNLSFTTLW